MYRQRTGGCVVIFASADREHLENLQCVMNAGHIYALKGKVRPTFQLTIGSRDMYEDLLSLGGTPRKSESALFPYVPDVLLRHFLRGFVDGDGSLYWPSSKSLASSPRISICGPQHFLEEMVMRIENETGISSPTIIRANKRSFLHHTVFAGLSAKCLAIWMYNTQELSLARKYQLAKEFINWHPLVYHPKLVSTKMATSFGEHLP